MDKTKNEESLGKTKDKLNEVIKENLTIKDLTSEAQTEEGAIQTEGKGDLTKPEPQVRSFIPVYDVETGEYLIYDEKNLLEATDEQLTPLNELLNNEVNLVKVGENSNNQRMSTVLSANKGILFLALIALFILLLLGYIFTKRKQI